MTICSDVSHRGTQFLTSVSDDKIIIDRQTFRQIFSLLGYCVDEMQRVRDSEIFLTSLDNYLSETNNPNISKAVLLLNCWLENVPDGIEKIADHLDEARSITNFILAASKLGRLQ
ncbi:MAG: hypothetical protein ACRC62_27605 [Microcoleus sp.]